jgi:aminomethyltransferase
MSEPTVTPGQPTDGGRGVLLEEHALLGARLGTWLDGVAPLAYPTPAQSPERLGDLLEDGCVLTDASGITMLYMAGDPAPSFGTAVFGGRVLAVGECAFEASLVGDGGIASIPLVARTGDREYLALDASGRGDTLSAWLSFVSGVEQNGFRPYDGLETEDVSERLVPLVLWGSAAGAVLGDYVPTADDLPSDGCVASPMLDGRIATITLRLDLLDQPCYAILVPPAFARILWRSLLSFESVRPLGTEGLSGLATAALPWAESLRDEGRIRLDAELLLAHGLVRGANDFVGARGLRDASSS